MQPATKLTWRYFLLSFALSFLVMSVVFLFLVTTATPVEAPPARQDSAVTGRGISGYLPDKEDMLTILCIMAPAPDEEAESFLLVKFDPVSGSVPVTALSPQTQVKNGQRQESLGQVYAYGGADYTRRTLAAELGITIHRYVRASPDAFISAARVVGSVEYDLPNHITYTQGGMEVTLSAGTQLLDGKKAAEIIRYRGYEGGEAARCAVLEDLAATVINQRRDVAVSAVVDSVFEAVLDLLDSDISYTDYDSRKEAAEFVVRMQQSELATPVRAEGRWEGDNFLLSDTSLARLRQVYG